MRAILADRYGSPDILRLAEVPTPAPKPGEVLIRIHAAAATPPDCAFRTGKPYVVRFFTGLRRPRSPILGGIMAGEIVALGAGVTTFAVGDRVFGEPGPPTGAYAEYWAVKAPGALAKMPAGLTFAEACAIADGGMTALPFLRDTARLHAGQRILIIGAAGAIGSAAVQLARHFGAHVTAVCGASNAALARSLGADRVIDYGKEDYTAGPATYDVVFDVVAKSSFRACRRILGHAGIYMTTVPSGAKMIALFRKTKTAGRRSLFTATGLRPNAAKLADLATLHTLAASGALKGTVGRTFPLEGTAEAHRYVETGHKRGSAIIAVVAEAAQKALAA